MAKNVLVQTAIQPLPVRRLRRHKWETIQDPVIIEEPLEVQVQGRCLARTLRVPGDDRHLVLGWCLSSGLIATREDVRDIQLGSHSGQARAEVTFASHVSVGSGLGTLQPLELPGRWSWADLPRVRSGSQISSQTLFAARNILESEQVLFVQTGATHCAALFAPDCELLAVAEDVGRHNALDKALGQALDADRLHQCSLLLLSSRLNGEMVSKAVRCGLPLMAGVSAATRMGIQAADRAGMTLIGFLRPERCNIYTHAWRIG